MFKKGLKNRFSLVKLFQGLSIADLGVFLVPWSMSEATEQAGTIGLISLMGDQ